MARDQRRLLLLGVTAVLAVLVGVLAQATGALGGLERQTVDARFDVRGDDTVPRDVVVMGITSDDYAALGDPVPRRRHARTLDRLVRAGARAVVFDLEFTTATTPRDDLELFRAVRRAGNVVLGTDDGVDHAVLGGPANVREARAAVGFAGFPADRAAVLRRVRPAIEGLPTLAAATARRLGVPVAGPAWIDYRGDARRVPYGARQPGVRGKVVVLGTLDPTSGDVHGTSVGLRFGVEVQAAAIDTLLRGAPLGDTDAWWLLVLLGALVPAAAVALPGLRWLPVAGLLVVAWPVAAQLAFDGGTILPFVPGAAAGLTGTLGTLVVVYALDVRTRRRMRAQFARFVPAAVVDEVVARAEDGAHLPGVRRTGTVLFADLRGFTTVAEQLEAEQVIALLNAYLSGMSDAILDHGGTVVSYMGDGIMAVFGAPLEQPDHADRALAAAREMLGPRLAAFNAEAGTGFALGIGLASGPVMSGTVGGARRVEYSAVGDTTNTAARLEAMTRDTGHRLHVHAATRASLSNPPSDLVDAGELPVRGRTTTVRVWALP